MSSSSSEDDDNDKPGSRASTLLKLIIRGCMPLVNKLGRYTERDYPSLNSVINTGEMALSILRSTRKIIPVFEAGKINGDKVDDTLQEFLCQYQIFSHAIGQFKVDRKVLAEMLLHLEELLKEFCGDWNKTRPVVMESQSSSSSSMKSTMKSNLPTSSKAEKNVEDSHKQFQTTELGPNMTRSEEEPGSPPQRKKQKFIFKKMSPKSDLLPKIECHLCRRCYNSLKALKKHLKEAHKGAEVGEGIKEIQHKITCKICQKKLGRDLMNRHLKDVHSMNKPNTSSQLRGWFSMDDGDGNWKPLWLLPNELDPSEEIMVPLNADGTYSLYGFTFKGKERGEAARFTNVEYNSVDVMTELASKHSFNDDQIRADEKKNAKVGVEEGNSSKSVQYHFEGDVITAVRDTTEDNSKEDVTEKTEGGNTNNDINFIEIGETEESNANREEMITKNAVNLSRRNLNVAIFPHDKPGSSQVVLNENVSRCDLEENFGDESFIFGDASSKPSVVRNLFDIVNDEDGACGEFNTVLKKGGSNETKKGHKVGLVKVSVFDLEVRDGELWSDETDSDFEHTDSKEYTEKRLRMKFTRKEKRNFQEPLEKIADVKANRSVIQDFEYFMKQQKMDNTSTPSKSSTIVKAIGHLFEYHDSLLKFETDKDASFNLQRLLNPLNDDFLEIADPTAIDGWIQRGTGPNGERLPGRCREKLKGHARFRDFLKAKLMKAEFGMSAEAYFKRDMIIKNIEQITQTIKSKKVFQQLQKMEDSEKLEREQAREVLFPKNVFNEMKAVSRWYKSEEAKEEEGACLNIYKKATTGGKMTSKEFGRFGQWAQFSTCLEDKNRRGAYSFTNLEFKKRKPMWFPEDFEEEETEDMNELFKKLPENWDWNVPPKPDAQPSCWVIEVSGEGLKGGNAAQLILTRRSSEICNKFRDLKFEVFGDDEDELSPFFVNMKKKPLTDLQRTKGSLLERLGKVCGVSNATVNTFRRAAEVHVQSSPVMKGQVEKLQLHSTKVGLTYYDKTGPTIRASFINQLSQKESPKEVDEATLKIPDAIAVKRKERDLADGETIIKKAKESLLKDKMKKIETRSKSRKVKTQEKEYLMPLFAPIVAEHSNGGTFPSDRQFKKIFYRETDTLSGEVGDNLRKTEEELFKSLVKEEVEKEVGPWTGTEQQNKCADMKIANIVKSSFRNYEKNRKSYEDSYFKFNVHAKK